MAKVTWTTAVMSLSRDFVSFSPMPETSTESAGGRHGGEPLRSVKIANSQSYRAALATVAVMIPIVGDSLDTAHAQMPQHLHVKEWKR
jgi:hypothetical protein